MHCKSHLRVIACVGGLLLTTLLSEAQTMRAEVATLSVPPLGSARSPAIKATVGQILTVRPAIEGELTPAVFIYDRGGQLYAKNDEKGLSSTFDWQVTESGFFEIVIYSNTDVLVQYSVLRLPKPHDRSPAAPSLPLAVVNLFWASNRNIMARSPVKLDNKVSQDNELAYGTCQVSIPRAHKRGLLEGPSILRLELSSNPEKHVVFLQHNTEVLTPDEFFGGVKKYGLRSTDRDALVFIHGFNVDFEDAARRAGQLAYDLEFKGPAVVFSWPSTGLLDPVSYNRDRTVAEDSAEPLRRLLTDLRKKTGVRRLHIVAHSMGNVPLARALSEMKDASGIRQIALMAPDIAVSTFEQLARRFPQRNKEDQVPRVTLYASDRDMALMLSRTYAGGLRRAGQGGPEIIVIPGVDTIDASAVDTSLLGARHQYFADNSQLLSDLHKLLRGESPAQRYGLQPRKTERGTYYVFVPVAR